MPNPARRAGWLLAAALLVLVAAEALRLYWILPFPGSQGGDTLPFAYALHRSRWPLRLVAGAVAAAAGWRVSRSGGWLARLTGLVGVALYAVVAWQANGPMSAEGMFLQPVELRFDSAEATRLAPGALVLGVALPEPSGTVRARAYPIRFLGYHHQIRDQLAGAPVMVTYCTVCRSGRVFSPLVDGEVESFRLVGMDRWNALFEDSQTGSWWRQATGEAVAGPLAGRRLAEIPSRQMTWAAWRQLHPESDAMAPDPRFAERYARMEGFEEGTNRSRLTGRDPESWREKSWVVGVLAEPEGSAARAFDWNELVRERALVDRMGELPMVLLLGGDGATFRAYDARLDGGERSVALAPLAGDPERFRDPATGTVWSLDGRALSGPDAGRALAPLPAYQEFWHSWRSFRPQTTARR